MTYTESDLKSGRIICYLITSTTLITPVQFRRTVTVHWVCDNTVYYRLAEDGRIKETTLPRFLEIINHPRDTRYACL
jgi:hypothetical protein